MGGPRVKIDPEEVKKLAAFQCTLEEIASFYGCSVMVIHRRYLKEYEQGREIGKMNIRRKQYQIAMGTPFVPGKPATKDCNAIPDAPAVGASTTMLIWLGKQWLGQKDKSEVEMKGGLNLLWDEALAKV